MSKIIEKMNERKKTSCDEVAAITDLIKTIKLDNGKGLYEIKPLKFMMSALSRNLEVLDGSLIEQESHSRIAIIAERLIEKMFEELKIVNVGDKIAVLSIMLGRNIIVADSFDSVFEKMMEEDVELEEEDYKVIMKNITYLNPDRALYMLKSSIGEEIFGDTLDALKDMKTNSEEKEENLDAVNDEYVKLVKLNLLTVEKIYSLVDDKSFAYIIEKLKTQ